MIWPNQIRGGNVSFHREKRKLLFLTHWSKLQVASSDLLKKKKTPAKSELWVWKPWPLFIHFLIKLCFFSPTSMCEIETPFWCSISFKQWKLCCLLHSRWLNEAMIPWWRTDPNKESRNVLRSQKFCWEWPSDRFTWLNLSKIGVKYDLNVSLAAGGCYFLCQRCQLLKTKQLFSLNHNEFVWRTPLDEVCQNVFKPTKWLLLPKWQNKNKFMEIGVFKVFCATQMMIGHFPRIYWRWLSVGYQRLTPPLFFQSLPTLEWFSTSGW